MSNKNMSKDLENRGWEDMSILLDKEMPQRRVGVLYWIWIPIFLLIGTLMFFLLKPGSTTSNDVNEEVAVVSEREAAKDEQVQAAITEMQTQIDNSESTASEIPEQKFEQKSNTSISEDQKHHTRKSEIRNKPLLVENETVTTSFAEKEDTHERSIPLLEKNPESSFSILQKLSSIQPDVFQSEGVPTIASVSVNEFVRPSTSYSNQSVWPEYVQFQFVNDFIQNIGIDLATGWEYSLTPKLSLQTGLAYSFDYIGTNTRKFAYENADVPDLTSGEFATNDEYREELTNYLNRSYSNDGDAQWTSLPGPENAFLRYGNLSQHMVSLEQNMLYRITGMGSRSALYAKAGGRISYSLLTSSSTDLLITYPVVTSGTVNFDNSGNTIVEPGSTYIPQWYYGLHAGLGVHINKKWSMEVNASTLQTLGRARDYLDLNKKRDVRFTLGVRRYF